MANFAGTTGNDTYAGTADDDTIHDGNGGGDSLSGDAGSDVITVTGGNDTVNGGSGADRLIMQFAPAVGGIGTISFSGDLATGYTGFYDGAGSNNVSFSGIEHFSLLYGATASAISMTTGDGNDSLVSGSGADALRTGGGRDTIDAGAGIDSWGADLSAETDDIIIDLGAPSSTFLGSASVTGVEGFNTIITGSGDDQLTSTGAVLTESIHLGAGNDVVTLFGQNPDSVDGGVGRDRLVVNYNQAVTEVGISGDFANGYSGLYDGPGSDNVSFVGIEDFTFIMTGAGVLRLHTGDGDDVITGGDGGDSLFSGGGVDVIDGSAGLDRWGADMSSATDDIIIDLTAPSSSFLGTGSVANVEGFTTLSTGSGNDRITGTTAFAAETIDAGAGDDIVTMNGRALDSVIAGDGDDRLVFNSLLDISLSGITGSLATGYSDLFDGPGSENLAFTGVEHFTVTYEGVSAIEIAVGDGEDVLLGGSGGDDFIGLGGDDALNGRGGSDSVQGGDGADTVTAGLGVDTVVGGLGSDRLVIDYAAATAAIVSGAYTPTGGGGFSGSLANSTDASNVIFSGFEDFHIFSGSAADTLAGADGDDLLSSGDGADSLDGRAGGDTLVGGMGSDTLTGGIGDDTADYTALGVRITADLSANSVAAASGGGTDSIDGVEHLTGSALNDAITGDGQENRLDGGEGADTVDGGAGDDTLIGGLGSDTASYASAGAGVTVALTAGAQNTGGAGSDVLSGFEHLSGSGFNDKLTGDGGANSVLGGVGADTLVGGLGDDTLDGGNGAADVADYSQAGAAITASLAGGVATGEGSDVLLRMEGIIGSGFADRLTGSAADNVLTGGDGKDTLIGGAGNDSLDGGFAKDTASYQGASAGVTVSLLLAGPQNTIGAGSDSLISIDDLTGSNFGDVLTGDGSANRLLGAGGDDNLRGGGGADTLDGGDRNDTIAGGAGDDELNGGRGKNTVTYADAGGGVAVSLDLTSAQNTGGDGTDVVLRMRNLIGSAHADDLSGDDRANSVVGGAGHDTLDGGDGKDRLDGGLNDDSLYGNLGQDRLNAGDGSDTLNGGARYDLLTGGAGNDTFVFDRVDLVSDRVIDLASGDTVDLSAIDADSTTGGNQAFVLVTGFHGAAGEARLNYKAGKDETLLELDIDGDGASDMTITLDGDQRGFTGFVL